jgi:heat shock protein HspQ
MNIDPNYFDSKEQQKEVLQKAKEGKYKEYFDKATAAVKACVTKRNRNERKQQHLIACSNRNFTTNNDLVVVDIEYAVSKLKPYNHATSDRGNKKVPKFDILAVDKKGQLYAIELKDNLRSDRKGSSQNIDGHKKDFDNSIGKECANNDFVSEMKEVLTQKQALGILPKGVEINCELPIFAIAYSGNPSEKSTFDESHKGIQLVDVSVGKRYLRLHK